MKHDLSFKLDQKHKKDPQIDSMRSVSEEYKDHIEDEKRRAGYNLKRSNLCGSCNTYKSTNGSCFC